MLNGWPFIMAATAPREILNKIDETILALISGGAVGSYSIAGRSISRYSLTELRGLRDYYAAQADAEESGGGVTYADMRGDV
jgi:hypothetical protein